MPIWRQPVHNPASAKAAPPAAQYDLTGEDLLSGRRFRQSGTASWDHSIGSVGYAGISPDCLRAKELGNAYFAGHLVGADSVVYGSILVMGAAFSIGEVAGKAAFES
ncbi:MAG: hypothetical protein COB08_001720 [Rhodobacteraceae bacterium]|nr:hypothetical protein [Paracoccaceae bacterium]